MVTCVAAVLAGLVVPGLPHWHEPALPISGRSRGTVHHYIPYLHEHRPPHPD